MRLTDHFTLSEATRSQIAARQGIDNTPPPHIIPVLQATALHILEPPRVHFGIPFSPSSFYRCLALNRALPSNDGSQHVKGEAADYEIPGLSNLELAKWCAEHLEFDQLILEFHIPGDPNSGWVHGSWRPEGRRGEVLTYSGGHFMRGLPL